MNIWNDLKLQYRTGGMAQKIIFINIALFVVPLALAGVFFLFGITFTWIKWFGLSSNFSDLLLKPWSIITYGFFHAGFFHILFNLLVLHFCARIFSTYFTDKQLLSHYLLGIIFSGLFYLISYTVFPVLKIQSSNMIGASGGVMAVLVAVAVFQPMMQIRLLLIGSVKLWHIALVLFVLDLIKLSSDNTGGHLAHIGGAVYGYIFAQNIKQGKDITKWFSDLMDYVTNLFLRKTNNKTQFKTYKNKKPVSSFQNTDQDKIDAILDKISKSGYDSLSKEEKAFLFKQKE